MSQQVIFRKTINVMRAFLVAAFLAATLSACATKGAPSAPISDPLEPANRAIFKFNDKIDRFALKPIAGGYRKITPRFVRSGVNNFFGNLGDVSTAANGFLQGKFKQGFSDSARVAVNTIIGIGGLLDVASQLDFEKHYEDFGQTLGVWGIPEGPYLVLPFFGPQTLRGTVGLLGDSQIEPLNTLELDRNARGSLVTLNVINARANLLAASSILDSGALDPYRFVKDRYVGWRRTQIYDKPAKSTAKKSTEDTNDLDELDELGELDELDDLDEPLSAEDAELEMLDELDDLDIPDQPLTEEDEELQLLNELDALDDL